MASSYRALLQEKNYIKTTLATFITRIGDGIDLVAFSWLVYEISGSTMLVATLAAINMIPNITVGLVSGVLCKYMNEKTIMWICDFGRGLCVGLVAWLYLIGGLEVWHLYVITFINSCFEGFRSPAQVSIYPKILKKENLEMGIALEDSLLAIGNLIGLVAAPMCIGFFSLSGALLMDAGSFLLCGMIIMCLSKIEATCDFNERQSFITDFTEGILYIKKDRLMLYILFFILYINALLVPVSIFQAAYVKDYLQMGTEGVSLFSVGQMVAMIVVTPFIPILKEKIPYRTMFICGGTIACSCVLLYGILPHIDGLWIRYALLFLLSALFGGSLCFVNVPMNTSIITRIDGQYLSRIRSVFAGCSMGMQPLASFIFGLVSNVVRLDFIYIVIGFTSILCFLLQTKNKVLYELNYESESK